MSDNRELDLASRRNLAVASWTGLLAERYSQIHPDVLLMSEMELTDNFKPSPYDYHLRKRFWEMTKARGPDDPQIEISKLYDGICFASQFYERILKNHYILSWMLTPLEDHSAIFEEFFYTLFMKMRKEMLDMPISEKTLGHFNKTLENLGNRVLGPVIQKIEQKSMNVTVDAKDMMKEVGPASVEDHIKELKSKITALPATATNVETAE